MTKIENELCCKSNFIHADAVEKAALGIPSQDLVEGLAKLYKVFGDETRLKILSALREGELCVCDLACLLDMSVSAISHQLRELKNAKLAKGRKEGKSVYYSLTDEHIRSIINIGLEHLTE